MLVIELEDVTAIFQADSLSTSNLRADLWQTANWSHVFGWARLYMAACIVQIACLQVLTKILSLSHTSSRTIRTQLASAALTQFLVLDAVWTVTDCGMHGPYLALTCRSAGLGIVLEQPSSMQSVLAGHGACVGDGFQLSSTLLLLLLYTKFALRTNID